MNLDAVSCVLLDLNETCLHVQHVQREVLNLGLGSCHSAGAVWARRVPGGEGEKTWQLC